MNTILARPVASIAAACVLACLAAGPAFAQGYPDRPVRLVIPFPPGGNVDLVGRIVGEKLTAVIGQPVVIDNRAGAGGSIGAEAVAKSAADGYTILLGSGSTHGTNAAVFRSLAYDPVRDFAPIVLIAKYPFVLLANPGVPAQSVPALIALAKTQPGKLNFGSYGVGSANHLPMELFKAMAGIDVVHVPYKGAAPALAGLMSGEVQMMFDGLGSSAQHIRSGKVRLLGIGGLKRTAASSDVPTIDENALPGFETGSFFALFAPAGTPVNATGVLYRATQKILVDRDLQEKFARFGYDIAGGGPEELGAVVASEVAKWQKLVRERGLKFE